MKRTMMVLVGTVVIVACTPALVQSSLARRRDERGLSQSTESALLIAGAVAVAVAIVTAVTLFVKGKLKAVK